MVGYVFVGRDVVMNVSVVLPFSLPDVVPSATVTTVAVPAAEAAKVAFASKSPPKEVLFADVKEAVAIVEIVTDVEILSTTVAAVPPPASKPVMVSRLACDVTVEATEPVASESVVMLYE